MKIVTWKNEQIVETPYKVDVRKLYDHENAQVMHIGLKAGEGLRPHITPVNVFFFILEGNADVGVGEETVSVEAGNLVESPGNIVHCLSNSSDSLARIMVVKSPRPATQSKLL